MANVAASIGIHGFWGLSASFDCLEAFEGLGRWSGQQDVIRILLVQPGDIRHILTTLTRKLRKMRFNQVLPSIHFYLLEFPIEVLSRDIALLDIFTDFEIPIRQRANLFLEVYGNSQVQDRTSRYLDRLGERLCAMIASGCSTYGLFDFSMLKYRERDELEAVLRSYSRSTIFDVESLRNQRMRGYYTDRYDSRRALYDWDWQYGVHDTASIIHSRLFRDWRESGISFEFGDQVYTEPNRTLMSYTEGVLKHGKEKGMKKEVELILPKQSVVKCRDLHRFAVSGQI
jgi:dynein assembly factor 3